MLTFTLWPQLLVRIGLAMLLSGLLTLGLLNLGTQEVTATSLVPTSDIDADDDAGEFDLLSATLTNAGYPLSARKILFIEENVVLPGYHAGELMPGDDSSDGSSANPSLTYDEIKFLYDNWLVGAREQVPHEQPSAVRPPESETSTVWPGISDLELIDEPRLHRLVPPRATSIDESELWLLEEPRMQRYHGRERAELIDALRRQNLADFDAMEQSPSLYTDPNPSASIQEEIARHRLDIAYQKHNWDLFDGTSLSEDVSEPAVDEGPHVRGNQPYGHP